MNNKILFIFSLTKEYYISYRFIDDDFYYKKENKLIDSKFRIMKNARRHLFFNKISHKKIIQF